MMRNMGERGRWKCGAMDGGWHRRYWKQVQILIWRRGQVGGREWARSNATTVAAAAMALAKKRSKMEHGIKMRTSNMLLAGTSLRDAIRNKCRKPWFHVVTGRQGGAWHFFALFRFYSTILFYFSFCCCCCFLPFFQSHSFISDDTRTGHIVRDNFEEYNTQRILCMIL